MRISLIQLIIMIGLFFTMVALANEPKQSTGGKSQILDVLRIEFQKRNPAIARVDLFDIRPLQLNLINYPEKPNHYLVVARGVRSDQTFQGKFEDELLGLFLFDESLSTIKRAVAFIPTQRWGDFIVKITRIWKDSVTVQGWDIENGKTDFIGQYYLLK